MFLHSLVIENYGIDTAFDQKYTFYLAPNTNETFSSSKRVSALLSEKNNPLGPILLSVSSLSICSFSSFCCSSSASFSDWFSSPKSSSKSEDFLKSASTLYTSLWLPHTLIGTCFVACLGIFEWIFSQTCLGTVWQSSHDSGTHLCFWTSWQSSHGSSSHFCWGTLTQLVSLTRSQCWYGIWSHFVYFSCSVRYLVTGLHSVAS